MTRTIRFSAPWGKPLKLTTALVVAILGGVVLSGLLISVPPEVHVVWILSMVALPGAILLALPLFMVRGYVLDGDTLWVERPGWRSEVSLSRLADVSVDPEATAKSWRTMGNGGGFAFTGWYRNRHLGSYRMFATDLDRAVVLRFAGDEPLVVTPHDPAGFVSALRER